MSTGVAIIVGVLAAALLFFGMQIWMIRKSQAMVGESPDFPAQWGHLAKGKHLVWFHSPTCGPCRAMERELEPFVKTGDAVEVDVMQDPAFSQKLGVMATPTTVLLKDGAVMNVVVGMRNQAQLQELLDSAA